MIADEIETDVRSIMKRMIKVKANPHAMLDTFKRWLGKTKKDTFSQSHPKLSARIDAGGIAITVSP